MGIYKHGYAPVWNSNGVPTQAVFVRVTEPSLKQFQFLFENLGMLLVGENITGAIGARCVDKSNHRGRYSRVEILGEAECKTFAKQAFDWLRTLCRECGADISQFQVEDHRHCE